MFPDEEGMYVVNGRLTPEVGALLMRAVEAASDSLYREKGPKRVSYETSFEDAAHRRADALGLIAERSLAAGFGENAPASGTKAERYQVLLHVDAETLKEDGGLGQSELEDGTRVSYETSRRLACDASVVRIGHARDGSVLDVGRKTRTIPPSVRRALEVRDRGCRFPGCGLRFTDAHHIKHWADGGETKLENLLLLCGHHHRLLHEEGWKVEWWAEGQAAFIDPRGQTHMGRPRQAPSLEPNPVEALIEDTRSRGADPDFYTAGARWKREADIPDEAELLARDGVAVAIVPGDPDNIKVTLPEDLAQARRLADQVHRREVGVDQGAGRQDKPNGQQRPHERRVRLRSDRVDPADLLARE